MNATIRFIAWGTLPLGGLLGGGLGHWLGNRNAMWAAAIGMTLASVWMLASPLVRMRDTETIPAEPELHAPPVIDGAEVVDIAAEGASG